MFSLFLATGVAVPQFAWPWLLAASLVPQLIGQTGFDYALKFYPPRVVATALLLEPVCAGLLAWAFLGEAVTVRQAMGSALVLVAATVAVSKEVPTASGLKKVTTVQ